GQTHLIQALGLRLGHSAQEIVGDYSFINRLLWHWILISPIAIQCFGMLGLWYGIQEKVSPQRHEEHKENLRNPLWPLWLCGEIILLNSIESRQRFCAASPHQDKQKRLKPFIRRPGIRAYKLRVCREGGKRECSAHSW